MHSHYKQYIFLKEPIGPVQGPKLGSTTLFSQNDIDKDDDFDDMLEDENELQAEKKKRLEDEQKAKPTKSQQIKPSLMVTSPMVNIINDESSNNQNIKAVDTDKAPSLENSIIEKLNPTAGGGQGLQPPARSIINTPVHSSNFDHIADMDVKQSFTSQQLNEKNLTQIVIKGPDICDKNQNQIETNKPNKVKKSDDNQKKIQAIERNSDLIRSNLIESQSESDHKNNINSKNSSNRSISQKPNNINSKNNSSRSISQNPNKHSDENSSDKNYKKTTTKNAIDKLKKSNSIKNSLHSQSIHNSSDKIKSNKSSCSDQNDFKNNRNNNSKNNKNQKALPIITTTQVIYSNKKISWHGTIRRLIVGQ